MILQLYQYIPNPPSKCRTNFSEPILTIANSAPNTGEITWTPPDTLEIKDNFVISGDNIWKEQTLMTGYQSGMFSIKHSESDVIPPSQEVLQSISEAAASASRAASQSAAWAAASTTASTTPTALAAGSNGNSAAAAVQNQSWFLISSFLATILGGILVGL